MARILILDDEEPMRVVIAAVLTKAGHVVTDAADGAAAIKVLERWQTDVLITDLVMPGKEGIETIAYVRRAFPDLPIIAISGSKWNDLYLRTASQMGAVRTLAKPFQPSALLGIIEEVLGRSPKLDERKAL